jgi:prolyl oligopeptidase
LPDESAFYYERLPQIEEVSSSEENYHAKIYKHELGNSFQSDQMIFGEGRPKNDMYGFKISKNGKYLLVRVAQNWNTSEVFLVDTHTNTITEIVSNIDAVFNPYFAGNDIVLYTDYKAPLLRVIKASPENLPESINEWQEIVPEIHYKLDSIQMTDNSLIATYLIDVVNKVHIYDLEGNKIQDLDTPPMSTTSCSANPNESELFVSVSNFFSQKTMFYLENRDANLKELRKAPAYINDNNYVVKQEWVTSKGGVKIPMFIIHKKDLDLNGKNPTILYGYGCHGIVKNPYYLGAYKPWIQRGGIFALANIRGGGEFGEEWHRAGSLDKKQNTFDDFIICSEYLIEHNYTNQRQLGIVGGSNGGLMVGAAMTQRPDLYKAVVCKVPVLDLYRFHLFLIAERWVHEFGDPRKKEEFEWLKK